jgi:hypothetical protein
LSILFLAREGVLYFWCLSDALKGNFRPPSRLWTFDPLASAPDCWDYRCVPPTHLTHKCFFKSSI